VLEAVDGINLSTNVELASGLVEVGNGGVLLIAAKDLLGLELPVGEDVISR
jgi:hypothetical protein